MRGFSLRNLFPIIVNNGCLVTCIVVRLDGSGCVVGVRVRSYSRSIYITSQDELKEILHFSRTPMLVFI
jgi:hypothetical protein